MIVRCTYDKMVPVSELIENPRNRNEHPKDQIDRLAQILEYQGWRYPIKVSKLSGFITSGHGRLAAARKLKLKEVPVNFQDYESDVQEMADLTSDNAIASWAELDLSSINSDIGELGPDFDIDLLGIKDFVIEPADNIPGADEDEVPEVKESKVVPGDLFRLNDHRLLCGDSTNIQHVERLMKGEKADMVFTDPPYGISYQSNHRKEKFQTLQNDDVVMSEWCGPAEAVTKGWVIFFCGWQRLKEWLSVGEAFGKLTNIIIWKKHAAMGDLTGQFSPNYELALAYNRGAKLREGVRPSAVFDQAIESASGFQHPTTKPIKLIEDIFGGLPHGSVLDLFLGSGSTLIACEKTNRKCFGMEIDPHYCAVILDRWEKYSGKKAHREDGKSWEEIKNG